jgi:hypothetical protein
MTLRTPLGVKAIHREVKKTGETYALREPGEAYAGVFDSKSEALSLENTIFWDENAETAET